MPDSPLRILMSRHSVFYSPVIATIATGFLRDEGLEATYGVLPAGQRARDLIRAGQVDIVQSAVSSSWGQREPGQRDPAVHFAQINCRDGFFLAARQPDSEFRWKKLEGATLLADHGAQPLAMLQYAAYVNGVDWSKIQVADAGSVEAIGAAFRSGQGDYVHQQGPAPQQLEEEGIGHVVVSVGESMPPVAFSSLLAPREFLETEAARRFVRAYRRGREWVRTTTPSQVARAEAEFFPDYSLEALVGAVMRYQRVGCWEGELSIPRDLYNQATVVFRHSKRLTGEHPYEEVVVPPPDPDRR
jgi:NitT/TauT family transport system substrate-binding protein